MDATHGAHNNVILFIIIWIFSVVMSISIPLALILTPLTPLTSPTQTWKIPFNPDDHINQLNYEPKTIINHNHITLTIMKIHVIMETNG